MQGCQGDRCHGFPRTTFIYECSEADFAVTFMGRNELRIQAIQVGTHCSKPLSRICCAFYVEREHHLDTAHHTEPSG